MEGHCARRSLRTPWKLGLRIVAWWRPRMFCEESLGKIKFRAFRKRVGPRILSLESVDYFGASEHYWVVEKKIRIWINKIVMVFTVCKWVLGWACDLFSAMHDWKDEPYKSLFRYLAMMLFLWNRGLWIFAYLYTRRACDRRRISRRR